MNARDAILFITAAFNLTLSSAIVFHNPKSRINIAYALAALAAALWATAIALFRLAEFPSGLGLARFYYVAAGLIAVFFLEFALIFPDESRRRSRWSVALYVPIVLFTVLLFGDSFISAYTLRPEGKHIALGPAYALYAAYFFGYVGAAFWILVRRFRQASGIARAQLKLVLTGVGIAMILGMWFNLLLPLLGDYRSIGVGPPFTMIMVGFIAYAIFKHHLYNIKIIATEAFGAVLSIILLVRLLASVSVTDFLLNAGVFGIAAVIVFLLIRSVLKEVEQREKIEALAAELGAANEELKRLDQAKSEFISIASHQLRAPLTIIKGYVSMLLEGTLGQVPSLVRESMGKVAISTEQLVRLIADLLDLSRIEGGRMKYEFDRVTMDGIVAEVVRELEAAARAKGLTLAFNGARARGLAVRADTGKLREVIMNLVDNAVKYTAQGGVGVSLYPETRDARPWLTLAVRDSGIGVKRADAGRMFSKFMRTEEAKRIRPDGLGLGLYVVKKIVEDHGGRVWMESAGLGQGSAFYVSLPVAA